MKTAPLLVFLVLSFCIGQAQTAKPDIQQQILDELRAIHRDARVNTTLQLLLAELQISQSTLDHAIQHRDQLKAQLADLQSSEKPAQADVVRIQAVVESATNPEVKEEMSSRLDEVKETLRKLRAQQDSTSEQLREAEDRLRTAQSERDSIQTQLTALIRQLSPAS